MAHRIFPRKHSSPGTSGRDQRLRTSPGRLARAGLALSIPSVLLAVTGALSTEAFDGILSVGERLLLAITLEVAALLMAVTGLVLSTKAKRRSRAPADAGHSYLARVGILWGASGLILSWCGVLLWMLLVGLTATIGQSPTL